MIRLLRSCTYRFLHCYSNYIIFTALLLFGVILACDGDYLTEAGIERRMEETESYTLEVFQYHFDLYEANSIEEFKELIYLRQFHQMVPQAVNATFILLLIIPSLIICRDVTNHSLQQDALRSSRTKAVFARVIQTHLIAIVICWITLICALGIYANWRAYPLSITLRNFVLAAVYVVSMGSFTCLIAVLVKRPIVNCAVTFLGVIMLVKAGLPLLPFIVDDSNSYRLAESGLAGELTWRLAYALVYFAVCTALTAVASRRVSL